MNTMTPEQRYLARHALGLPNSSGISYRNHYVTHADGPDGLQWEALCALGLAVKRAGNPISGGDPVYVLTRPGAEKAINANEHLASGAQFPMGALEAGRVA